MNAIRTLVMTLLTLAASNASAQDWTRFRGPNGSGLGQADNLPARFGDKDFRWQVKLPGAGHSSPVLWGKKLFVTSAEDKTGKRLLQCLDADDGKTLWTHSFGAQAGRMHRDNSVASATPAVDDQHVYVAWGNAKEYLVAAVDHAGKEVWRVDLGPYKSGHGFGASPIVVGDLLIVPNDQDGPGSIVALECKTGREAWKVKRTGKASWATPCIFQPKNGTPEVICTSYEHGISSFDARTGKRLWESDVFSKGHVESPIGSPIVAGDLVLGSAGWLAVNYEIIAVKPGLRNESSRGKEIYRLDKGVPLCLTPLAKDELLFVWSDGGQCSCVDVHTGKVHWRERVGGSFYGSPVCAGNRLYCIARDGEVVVLSAARKFEVLARNKLGEGSHSTPALAHGRMYLRTFTQLFCLEGK
ncbi:MAG: PQQ-binding-like beta-propeller repeat protein [Gemmataceae bacterium]